MITLRSVRGSSRRLALALALLVALPLLVVPPSTARAAASGAVEVWTTAGQDAPMARQSDLAFVEATPEGLVLTVDEQERHQSIDGFGGALTESSAHLIAGLPAPERTALLAGLFSPDGLNLSALRLPLGSSDFALTMRTYDDLPKGRTDPALAAFSIDADRRAILPVLREIQAQQPDLWVMATPWSAPAWMKQGSSSLIGGSLSPKHAATYGRYLRRAVDDYALAGVRIDALSPQNEPLHVPRGYPGMGMSATQQAAFVADHLGPALAGTATKILAFDHNWSDAGYAVQVLDDARARPHLAGAAFHCYGGQPELTAAVSRAHPTAELHMTECASGTWSPDWNAALRWDVRMLLIRAGRAGSRTAIKWNLALDPQGGPRVGGCGTCRGMVTIDPGTGRVTANHDVHALGHASAFVRSGAVRVGSTSLPADGLESIAYANADGSIVVVVLNDREARPISLRWGTRTVGPTLPARSVTTFHWDASA